MKRSSRGQTVSLKLKSHREILQGHLRQTAKNLSSQNGLRVETSALRRKDIPGELQAQGLTAHPFHLAH